MLRRLTIVFCLALFPASAFADCPEGTWPRDLYSGPGGGLSTAQGGGMYTGPGGGASRGRGGGLYTGPGGGMSTGPGGGLYTGPGGGLSRSPGGGLYTGPGGGLSRSPGGGLYAGPGGGLYSGPETYCRNIPPLPVFIRYLQENGYERQATVLRDALDG